MYVLIELDPTSLASWSLNRRTSSSPIASTPPANSIILSAILISRQVGGNLSETLVQTRDAVIEISRLEGKIKTMTAQGKLQAIVICSLPVVFGVACYFIQPDMITPLFHDILGTLILAVVLLLEGIGIFFIRKIIQVEV